MVWMVQFERTVSLRVFAPERRCADVHAAPNTLCISTVYLLNVLTWFAPSSVHRVKSV